MKFEVNWVSLFFSLLSVLELIFKNKVEFGEIKLKSFSEVSLPDTVENV